MAVLFGHKFPMVSDMVADTCDHCVNETQNCETRDTSVIITFVLGPDDQTQPGSLSLSHSAGMGRTEPWERGWWRGGRRKESLQLRLWNLNICIKKVDAKCSLADGDISNDIITLGMCLQCLFTFALIGENLTARSMGSHRGIGGRIQIPET